MHCLQTSQRGTTFFNTLRAHLDRSGRSEDRRDHQFPLQREAFDRPYDETGKRSRAFWRNANRIGHRQPRAAPSPLFPSGGEASSRPRECEVLLDLVPELAPQAVNVQKLQVFSTHDVGAGERVLSRAAKHQALSAERTRVQLQVAPRFTRQDAGVILACEDFRRAVAG